MSPGILTSAPFQGRTNKYVQPIIRNIQKRENLQPATYDKFLNLDVAQKKK